MKRISIIVIVAVCNILCACGTNIMDKQENNDIIKVESNDADNTRENDIKIISEALGVDENTRNIRFIISTLDTLGVEQLINAEATVNSDDIVLNIESSNHKKYSIYLSKSGSVEAVKDLDTEEWVIKSDK